MRIRVDADYLALVKQFPVRAIRSEQEHAAAGAVIDNLVGREDLTPGQLDYLEALVRSMQGYEQSRHADKLSRLAPAQVLRHLMTENDMGTSDLGVILGSRGLASEVLNGKRSMSKRLIAKLAAHFNVDPTLFLAAPPVSKRRAS
jgi:HTH-type transcriptional regulator / antitoxin HigA